MNLGNFRAYFKHTVDKDTPTKGETSCKIVKKEGKLLKLLGSGHSATHVTDTFIKTRGRKVALKKALKDANLNKEERSLIWANYFNIVKDLKLA